MTYFRTAAYAATSGLALIMATPVLASPSCELVSFKDENIGNPTNAAVTNQQALEQLVAARDIPVECRPAVVSEALRSKGLNSTDQLVHQTQLKVATVVKYTPPAPKPAAAATPTSAATSTAPIMVSRPVVQPLPPVETPKVQAARQEVAQLQTERSAAVQRVTVLKKVYAQGGFTDAERKSLNDAIAEVANIDSKIAKAKKYVDEQIAAVRAELGKKANAVDVYTKAQVDALKIGPAPTSPWTPKWWWFATLVGLGALVTWWLASRKSSSSVEVILPNVVTHEELKGELANHTTKSYVKAEVDGVRDELHGRINRVTDDVQLDSVSQELLKAMKPNHEAEATFMVNSEPAYRLKFTKVGAKNFATTAEVGDTPAGQDIGDALAFVRRAHAGRQDALKPFKID